MAEQILEPLDMYESTYKDAVHNEAQNVFDSIIEESKFDKTANEVSYTFYEKAEAKYKASSKNYEKSKNIFVGLNVLLGFSIAFVIVGILIMTLTRQVILGAVLSIVFLIASIVLPIINFQVIKPKREKYKKTAKKDKRELNARTKECKNEMTAIAPHFDWDMPVRIVEKCVPVFKFSKYYSMEDHDYLTTKYGVGSSADPDSSMFYLLKGEILNNPFLYERYLNTYMGTMVYEGEIIISYQERERNSDGNMVTTNVTETLTAEVEKPCPYYNSITKLEYVNDAVPNLVFSREADDDKNERELQRYAQKELKKGNSFTPMANTEFETKFHAWNRSNEQQFRLLFTPLAQENILKIINSKDGYGDDFNYYKDNRVTTIISKHSQSLDMSMSPYSYGQELYYKDLEKDFINYCDNYFKSLYFDLAVLISTPLYQQYVAMDKTCEKKKDKRNYPSLTVETIVNYLPIEQFKPIGAGTSVILKCQFLDAIKDIDLYNVSAFAYQIFKEVEYVPAQGGDGQLHDVPVEWDRYEPISDDSHNIIVLYVGCSNHEFLDKSFELENKLPKYRVGYNYIFYKGFVAIIVEKDDDIESIASTLKEIFK
ncbi:MAG: DUF4870 domain-containing protein [Coprobacillus sp.]|nr:DUF4870 domain-containing protein [Coprobacillus sp.]